MSGAVPEGVRGRDFPAVVPGVVHTSLQRAGVIPDVRLADNELTLRWIGRATWQYSLDFEWLPDQHTRHDLVFDGLDTVAVVRLNGSVLAETANQHRTYRFDAREGLVPGHNRLVVDFLPALEYAYLQRDRLGPLPQMFAHPLGFIRKSACNFGWDWGPEAITAGVWRGVRIESWSGVRLDAVRAHGNADGAVRVAVDTEHESGARDVPAEIECTLDGRSVRGTVPGSGVLRFELPSPRLWWPRGYGDAPLYELSVRVGEHVRRQRIGFRTVEIVTQGAGPEPGFWVHINGVPVTSRGVNWIPDGPFPSESSLQSYRARLADATDLGANTVRVWGGGVFEADEFYDTCDELGLMLWQDFMFACAAYPEEEPIAGEVVAEARDALNRLSSHPAIVLWNGSNENLWGITEWEWEDAVAERTWGRGYYLDLLPRLVEELDASCPYIPSSPFSWRAKDQNAPSDGLTHAWHVWNVADYTEYTALTPRFVSEFGLQSAAASATLRAAITDDSLSDPHHGQLRLHQKGIDGATKLDASYRPHLPEPTTFDEWVWTTQLNHAQGLRLGIEHFRGLAPVCTGAIVWQLNDAWPAVSWALVDASGVRKPAWFATRRAFGDRLCAFTAEELVLVNDAMTPWEDAWELTLVEGGECCATDTAVLRVPPGGVLRAPLPSTFRRRRERRGLVIASAGEVRALRFDDEPKTSSLRPGSYDLRVRTNADGADVDVTAHEVIVDLCLLSDRFDPVATVDSGMVSLLPGETHTFRVSTEWSLTASTLETSTALRSLNDALHPGNIRRPESARSVAEASRTLEGHAHD